MYRITDTNPIFLSCQVEEGALILTHAGTPLEDGALEVKLKTLAETVVAISDFEHSGNQYRVDAFTRASDGSLTPWERTSEGVRRPVYRPAAKTTVELDVMVVSSSHAPSGEATARQLAAFEQRSAYTPAAVKIRVPDPEDSRPGG